MPRLFRFPSHNPRTLLAIDGDSHQLLYRHFFMTSGELVRMLRIAPLNVTALYRDTDDNAFAPGSPRLLLVAVKNQAGCHP